MSDTKNSWEVEFQALSGRERAAFRWLEQTLYKLSVDPRTTIINEMEEAFTVWQGAAKALVCSRLPRSADDASSRLVSSIYSV